MCWGFSKRVYRQFEPSSREDVVGCTADLRCAITSVNAYTNGTPLSHCSTLLLAPGMLSENQNVRTECTKPAHIQYAHHHQETSEALGPLNHAKAICLVAMFKLQHAVKSQKGVQCAA